MTKARCPNCGKGKHCRCRASEKAMAATMKFKRPVRPRNPIDKRTM